MREISLHILDVVENALRAGASVIAVTIAESRAEDWLKLIVEDNGPGLTVTPEQALDPYYTTKNGKRTGLGLSLFKAAAERAGGSLSMDKSRLGGLQVDVKMQLSNVDRQPLGDLATTLSSVVCTNPALDLWCQIKADGSDCSIRVSDVAREIDSDDRYGLVVARRVSEKLRAHLTALFSCRPAAHAAMGLERIKGNGNNVIEKERCMSEQTKPCACTEGLSEEELLERLNEVIADYRDKPGALIPVLQIAQAMFGYLPESALKAISLGLSKSYSEVAGVVSFYSFFSTIPRGKHVIRVCLGTACYVRGGKQVLEALKQRLGIDVGQTTEDRLFSLDVARCFGACGLAPAIMIDNDVYQRVKPTKIQAILDEYIEREDLSPVNQA